MCRIKAVFTADSESSYFYGTYEIENVIQKLDITDLVEFPETCGYTGYTQSLSATLNGFDYFTYSVKYNEEPVNAGTYTATITGTGNFTGTVERTFQVLPAKLSVNIYLDTKYYDGTTDVVVSRANLLGVRADDDVTMDYSELEVILPSADAGVYKTAEIKGISLTGEDLGNYTFDASEGVALKGYYGGDFRISTRQLIINAEDQKLDSGETPDQSMWYCDSVPYGFTVSDIVLTANEEELRIVPSGGVVTEDSTGRDVTHNFWFDYSWAYLTLNCTNHTPDDNGFCSNCGGYEAAKLNDNGTPEEEWDDYYEISNAGQLYWYAEQVNAYYSSVSAVLVDDIVVNEDLTAENLREWTPIGSGSPAYVADFDGQGHTVSGLYCNLDHDYVGFFGYTDYNYPISNLGIKDSYFEGNNYVGAFAGYASSAISNCFVENVEVVCNGYNGADFVGYNGGYIENCYSASDSFVYRNYGSITNSYYLADEEIHNEDGLTFKTAEQFRSGEVAYLLQAGIAEEDIYDDEWNYIETIIPEIWGQKIGEDNYPVLGGDKVYMKTDAEGNAVYYNKTAEDNTDKPAGYTISLGDKVAVNYYMSLTEETLKDANAKMIFTVPDTGSYDTVEIPVSEAVKSGDYYVFTCEVAAKEMTSVIKAQIVMSDGTKSSEFEYTVKEYAEYMLANPDEYANEQSVVKAMLNYGASAQAYFNYNTENLANDTEYMTNEEKAVSLIDFTGAGYTLEGEEAGVKYYGTALSLESELAFKHYFIIDESVNIDELEIDCKYETKLKKNGNLYELKISGIPAHQVATDVEVKLGGITLKYSVASYGAIIQNGNDTALKTVVSALAAYSFEAASYALK